MSEPQRSRAELMLALVVLIWGTNFAVVKGALTLVDRHAFNALRFSASALLLAALWAAERRRGAPRAHLASWGDVAHLAALGLFGGLLYQLVFIEGIARTSTGNCALLIATAPLWTAFTAWLLGLEQLPRAVLAGALTTLVGVAALSYHKLGGGDLSGDLLCALGGACWGIYTALSKPALAKASPMAISAVGVLTALPFLWLVALPTFDPAPLVRLDVCLAVAYSGLLSVGVAYWLWSSAVQQVGPSRTAIYVNAVPLLALVIGALALAEPLGWNQLVGAALITIGLALARRRPHVRVAPARPGVPSAGASS